jgi:hypothetical protein
MWNIIKKSLEFNLEMFNLSNKRNQQDEDANFDDYVLICFLLENQKMLHISK